MLAHIGWYRCLSKFDHVLSGKFLDRHPAPTLQLRTTIQGGNTSCFRILLGHVGGIHSEALAYPARFKDRKNTSRITGPPSELGNASSISEAIPRESLGQKQKENPGATTMKRKMQPTPPIVSSNRKSAHPALLPVLMARIVPDYP